MIAYHLEYKPQDFIDNRFLVVNKIGSGSYGDVFCVKDSHNQIYALKLLRLWEVSGSLREELSNKFRQEYQTAQIKSDYLVHSLKNSYNVVRGNPYFLMEYCPNGDLAKVVETGAPHIANYAHDILMGLYAIHSEGLVHRDLKPDNVLFRSNGCAALTDFGVVGNRHNMTPEVGWLRKHLKQALGTPLYMAPEMYNRKGGITYLPTVDLWSFGVMMFELLTRGSFPFGNIENIEDLPIYMKRAKNRNRDYFYKLEGNELWCHIIDKLLEPDQHKRYQSTIDVIKDLEPIIGKREVSQIEHKRNPLVKTLHITQGDEAGTIYELKNILHRGGRMIEVGRSENNDIILPEKGEIHYVSRHHFTLEQSQQGRFWIIRDGQWNSQERVWVRSTNGTYLNATDVSTHGLRIFSGDIITAGEYKLKVE